MRMGDVSLTCPSEICSFFPVDLASRVLDFLEGCMVFFDEFSHRGRNYLRSESFLLSLLDGTLLYVGGFKESVFLIWL